MSALEQLYQQIILEHSKQRSGEGLLDAEGHRHATNHQYNPTCGDEIKLRIALKDDADVIDTVSWEGDGCSISMAATSVLSQMAPGLTTEEFQKLVDDFREMLRSRGTVEPDEEVLGDAAAFAGVSKFVARVKCAMLSWVAAEEATQQAAAQTR